MKETDQEIITVFSWKFLRTKKSTGMKITPTSLRSKVDPHAKSLPVTAAVGRRNIQGVPSMVMFIHGGSRCNLVEGRGNTCRDKIQSQSSPQNEILPAQQLNRVGITPGFLRHFLEKGKYSISSS